MVNRYHLSFLGVYLDRHLNFKKHFKMVKEDCQSRTRLLRTITSRHNHNNRNTALRISTAIVTSKLLYGIELTCRASEEMVHILEPIYNRCIRIVSGLLPSTPASAACVEAGVLPFYYVVAISTCTRAISFMERTYGDVEGVFLLAEANKLLREIAHQELPPVAEMDRVGGQRWDSPKPTVNWAFQRNYKVGGSTTGVLRIFNHMKATTLAGYDIIFTDGSKVSDRIGIGVSGKDIIIHQRLPNMCSVFSAEAAAIHLGVQKATSTYTAILSDSASVLKALETDRIRHPWIQAIRTIAKPTTLFVWIPGHCGIPGNEKADRLAALGRNSLLLTEQVPCQDLKIWVKNIVSAAWAASWQEERQLFLRKVKGEPHKWTDQSNWKDQRILSRMRTGHTRISHMPTGQYLQVMCDSCGTRQSIEHILAVCPQYQSLRTNYKLDTGIRDILANNTSTEAALLCFLKDAKLYNQI